MPSASSFLIDTNILLRIAQPDDSFSGVVTAALHRLGNKRIDACFALQNIAEFWNVCTRPLNRNGFGLSVNEANQRAEFIERTMTFLPDNDRVYSIWRKLVIEHNVRGVQVHDARLVAVMLAHGVGQILTLNHTDFLRYQGIQAIHPSQV